MSVKSKFFIRALRSIRWASTHQPTTKEQSPRSNRRICSSHESELDKFTSIARKARKGQHGFLRVPLDVIRKRKLIHRIVWSILVTAFAAIPAADAQRPSDEPRWFRGNLHTHTINSDGDSPPYDVMAWYKLHSYQFLVITDHNTFTGPGLFDTNPNDNFLLIGGEEITNRMSVHVNAIGINRVIPPHNGSTVTELVQVSIDAVHNAGGIPLINHPNYAWALTVGDMLPLKRTGLLEIASSSSAVNHYGDR